MNAKTKIEGESAQCYNVALNNTTRKQGTPNPSSEKKRTFLRLPAEGNTHLRRFPSKEFGAVFQETEMMGGKVSAGGGVKAKSKTEYQTPPLAELQQLIWKKGGSDNHVDQVWTNLYLGDGCAAANKNTLKALGITHIVNAAHRRFNLDLEARFYKDLQVKYLGVEAFDGPAFNISAFFYPVAEFLKEGLSTSGGKVFVHCVMGISRAASLVVAFLMIYEHMTLVEALKAVNQQRDICPNSGFLSQLQELDIRLVEQRRMHNSKAKQDQK
ncbi:dual specificity protein phosphatase 13B-like isoform X1 [Latimeria chalumnae]|uniref:dual specificity protein phosphatase 13B-like isoform X1 n=1 Tax=Latimeria chalumnae TaxID=7897 RepID=UPI00313AD97D